MNAVENARRIIASAERTEANIQKIKNLICTSLGLAVIEGERHENLATTMRDKYNTAQTFYVHTPTGKAILNFDLWWDDDGKIRLTISRGMPFPCMEEVLLEIKKMNRENQAGQ
jgi:hypothetical protein